VIISDGIELPFEDVLDYSEFGIFVQTSDAVKKGYLLYLLRGIKKDQWTNLLGGGPMVRAWDQEVCSLCGLRFEPCGCSYDGHWRLTWSLTSGPVGLVEVRTSWPGHPR
jgi:hypothetical protein